MEMVKWIGKISLLLKRLRDAWVDMLPMSFRNEQVSDDWTTSVARYLNEAQRKQLPSPLSLQGVDVTACTC